MSGSSVLKCILSTQELERIRQGRCIVSDAPVNHYVQNLLTHDSIGNAGFQRGLAEWFALADEQNAGEHYRHRIRTTVNDYAQFLQTVGELMAGYFIRYNLACDDIIYNCAQNGHDITCVLDGQKVNCEVKTCVGGLAPDIGRYTGPVLPATKRLWRLLDSVTPQLPKGELNLVMIADWWRPHIGETYLGDALYGTEVYAIPYGLDGPVGEGSYVRKNDGKCTEQQMTRISAVGCVRMFGECDLCGWFMHNVHACSPISPHLLDPWSQRVPCDSGQDLCWRNGSYREVAYPDLSSVRRP